VPASANFDERVATRSDVVSGTRVLEISLDHGFEVIGIEAERTDPRVVDDPTGVIDEIDSSGSRRVELCDVIVHRVDVEGNDAFEEVGLAARGDLSALIEGDGFLHVRARELTREIVDQPLCSTATQPPAVTGVGFLHVDDDEFDTIAILLEEFLETHGPVAEWRSGITAKDEGDRSLASEV
jgi:hypothetical protein